MAVGDSRWQADSPLIVHSREGLGKTHLLLAIESAVRQHKPDVVVAHLTAEKLANECLWSERNGTLEGLRKRYRHSRVLLLDDIQRLVGFQGSVVVLLRELLESGRRVVLTSDCPLPEIVGLSANLLEYLQHSSMMEIHSPDFNLRYAIVQRMAEALVLNLPDATAEFIARHVTKSVRQMEGALLKLSCHARRSREPLNIEITRALLGDLIARD